MLRSQKLQKKVDKHIRELDQNSHFPGNGEKFKSQRGGGVDVPVKRKVQWPHEAILGGVARQRVTYDQLSLTQWVQGFCKNILEKNQVVGVIPWCLISVTLWKTPQIFRGREPRRLMPSCSAKWSGGHLLGRMGRELIGAGGLMPKNMFQVGRHGLSRTPRSHGSAKIFRTILARFKRTMNRMGDDRDIYVRSASPRGSS